jgi:hypothetical protein
MTSEVATRATSQVPDLVRTPALEITAEDIALPRIYIGQYMSRAVQEQLVKPGVIFAATGADDPDPNVLWHDKDGTAGVKFYVLSLRKGKSWTAGPGEELQLFDFDDPNAPPDAWVTYGYTVCVPSVDEEVPFKLLLTRTGKNAALQINTVLKKGSISGPAWESAFLMTTAPRENNKGKFYVPRIAIAEAKPKEVEIAQQIAVSMSSSSTAGVHATSEVPAI